MQDNICQQEHETYAYDLFPANEPFHAPRHIQDIQLAFWQAAD